MTASSDRPLLGVAYAASAFIIFAGMNVMVKHLTQHYPVPEVVWVRYAANLAFMLILFPTRWARFFDAPRIPLQFLRGLLIALATVCTFSALYYLPVPEVAALSFVSPLIVTALSVVFLREVVGWRRWAAVAVGFVGMLIIVRPGSDVFHPAAFLPLTMACLLGVYAILTRKLGATTDPVNSLFYIAFVGTVGSSLVVPFFWVTPSLVDAVMMAAVGLLGGAGHLFLIKAFEKANASTVAPIAYTELVWATLLALAVFGYFPDAWTLTGAAIIAASGLYIAHRERLAGRARRNIAAA